MSTFLNSRALFILALLTLAISSWHCDGSGTIVPNASPITRLANIPPEGITSSNPRLSLFWVGDDPDGFVVGYQYRWSFRLNPSEPFQYKAWTTLLNIGIDKTGGEKFALLTDSDINNLPAVYRFFSTLPPEGIAADSSNKLAQGDSLVIAGSHVWASNPEGTRFPVHVNPNSGTFIFDSQDSLNPHTFEVAAIDNNGALDARPATVSFITPKVDPPHCQITSTHVDTVLVLDRMTDTFRGIEFRFLGIDPNSRTIDYQWVVDKDAWVAEGKPIPWSEFSQSQSARVNASHFPPSTLLNNKHKFYVRARNEFGSIDTTGFFIRNGVRVYCDVDFYTVFPDFARPGYTKRTLIINASWDNVGSVDPAYPTAAVQDDYYKTIFNTFKPGAFDTIHIRRNPDYFPTLGILSHYSSIFIHGDIIDQGSYWTGRELDWNFLYQYVNVGGKIVMTYHDLPLRTPQDKMQYIPHCENNNAGGLDTTFIGATGEKGYPTLELDSAKLDPAWNGAISYVWAGRPFGFGEIIYRYHENGPKQPFPGFFQSFEGQTVGVRYDGLTYKVVYFGFPLYYCKQAGVEQALQKAFQDIGE